MLGMSEPHPFAHFILATNCFVVGVQALAVGAVRRVGLTAVELDHAGGRGLVEPAFLAQPIDSELGPLGILAGALGRVAPGTCDQFRGACLLQRFGKRKPEAVLVVAARVRAPEFLGLGGVGRRRGLGPATLRSGTTGGRIGRRHNRCVFAGGRRGTTLGVLASLLASLPSFASFSCLSKKEATDGSLSLSEAAG